MQPELMEYCSMILNWPSIGENVIIPVGVKNREVTLPGSKALGSMLIGVFPGMLLKTRGLPSGWLSGST